MRILNLGGNMLVDALREAGHEVATLGVPGASSHPLDSRPDFFGEPAKARSLVAEAAGAFRPDWILQTEDSTPLIHLGVERLPWPKAWYAVDTHLHFAWQRHYAAVFDRVFCAQQNQVAALAAFGELRARVEWLPLWFTPEPTFLPWGGRAHDVSFVGSLDAALNPRRIALLDGVRALGLDVNVRQGDCAPVYRASRVVINQSVKDDLNLRVFEAMGCGALLVTDRLSHSLEDIGTPGVDFLVYEPGRADDLCLKVRWALAHPAEAEAMARRGMERVAARHRVEHRVRRLVEALSEDAGPGVPEKATHEPGQGSLGHLAAAHEHVSRLALPASVCGFFAAEARRLGEEALAAFPGDPFAVLVLSQLDLESGALPAALARLEGAEAIDGGAEYRRRRAFLLALLLAHAGRAPEARRTALSGLREFPGDADLTRLQGLLFR